MSDTKTVEQLAGEVLTGAADRLEGLLDTAQRSTTSPWWWTESGLFEILEDHVGYDGEAAADAAWMVAMSPTVGRTLIALLRRGAWLVRFDPDLAHRLPMDEVLTFARMVLHEGGRSDAA